MYNEIISVFKQFTELTAHDKDIIQEIFKPKILKKNDYFLKEGQLNNKAAFIRKGLVRYYVIKNEEESTLEFTKESEFVADFPSFSQRGYSVQYIQALEDCELLVANYVGIQRIYNEISNGNLIGRLVMEDRIVLMMNQILSIYKYNPEKRYEHFIKNYSCIAERIPQYLIASYIGIKPQSLSRIRNKMKKQGIY